MRHKNMLILLASLCLYAAVIAQTDTLIVTPAPPSPDTITLDVFDISFEVDAGGGHFVLRNAIDGIAGIEVNGETEYISIESGIGKYTVAPGREGNLVLLRSGDSYHLAHVAQRADGSYRYRHLPMWLSILPPLIAIFFALVFREVFISLFVGVWTGAFIAGGMRIESLYYFIMSLYNTVSRYVINALTDSGHMSIIVFTLLIGGMVAIVSRNGGMAGVVLKLSRYARSPRSAQFVTWLLGIAIFFDDYANTLIVGNTMRPVTDRFRISREKLAYIVDSTAAPVAAVAFITTWIGAELGYIDSGLRELRDYPFDVSPYGIFISSLRYSFYPVLTLLFIFMLVYMRRDFGPMWKAEHRTRTTGTTGGGELPVNAGKSANEEMGPKEGAPLRWYNAAIPVLLVIFVTIYGLVQTGLQATLAELIDEGIAVGRGSWSDIWQAMAVLIGDGSDAGFFRKLGVVIGNGDSYIALIWASLSGVVAAILLTTGQRIMKLLETMHNLTQGFKTMLPALIILTLAWALAETTGELRTADFMTSMLSGNVDPHFMPAIVFILAALIAFSTGSSWSTMAILYPIAIPTTWAVCMSAGMDPTEGFEIMLNVIATVLAASVLGDHCSPISDTTILSSLAADCNHVEHVRTQLPYALTVGAVSLIANSVATYFGGGWGLTLVLIVISLGVFYLIIRKVGKHVEAGQAAEA